MKIKQGHHRVEAARRLGFKSIEVEPEKPRPGRVSNAEAVMSADELRETLEALNLTPNETAALLRVNERVMPRWLKGRYTVPGSVAILLRALRAGILTIDQVYDLGEADYGPR